VPNGSANRGTGNQQCEYVAPRIAGHTFNDAGTLRAGTVSTNPNGSKSA
jgi:hypothetical protein